MSLSLGPPTPHLSLHFKFFSWLRIKIYFQVPFLICLNEYSVPQATQAWTPPPHPQDQPDSQLLEGLVFCHSVLSTLNHQALLLNLFFTFKEDSASWRSRLPPKLPLFWEKKTPILHPSSTSLLPPSPPHPKDQDSGDVKAESPVCLWYFSSVLASALFALQVCHTTRGPK